MPYNGAGVYSFASGILPSDGDTIDASDVVAPLNDLANAQNTPRPVVAGGTGASTAGAARTALGLVIGTDVQAYDAGLQSIASLTTAADQMVYLTGADTYATTSLTSFARTLLDDTTQAQMLSTLGLGLGWSSTAGGANADLNNQAASGVYQTSTSAANLPGTAAVHALWHAQVSANLASQIAMDLATTEVYVRRKTGGTWAAWRRLPSTSDMLGYDQTWQDVSASRSGSSTSYQNTTGKPIMVIVRMASTSSHTFQVSSDNSTWITIGNSDNDAGLGYPAIIPPNHYYRITGSTFANWTELR